MASTSTRLTTFAEFEQLPDAKDGRYELHHGEVVLVSPPKHKHYRIQSRLRRLLEAAAGHFGTVELEMSFRPKPEYEYWVGDVALLSTDRWEQIDPNDNIQGVPELVIEVLSPANTVAEMLDKRQICLENGTREFWMVNPNRRQVEVSTPDGHSILFVSGQRIPLFCGGEIAVDEIFA